MAKNKNIIIAAVIIVIVLAGGWLLIRKRNTSANGNQVAVDTAPIIFFYGKECPHCQNVEKFISDNNLAQKVNFSQREVYHDQANSNLMIQKARECGIKDDQIGVPFLWAMGKCYEGEDEVEKFLTSVADYNSQNSQNNTGQNNADQNSSGTLRNPQATANSTSNKSDKTSNDKAL